MSERGIESSFRVVLAITNILSKAPAPIEPFPGPIKSLPKTCLVRSHRQNDESATFSGVNRPGGAGAALWSQLEEVRLSLQRLHIRAGKLWPEEPQLFDRGKHRVAVPPGLHCPHIDGSAPVEVDQP